MHISPNVQDPFICLCLGWYLEKRHKRIIFKYSSIDAKVCLEAKNDKNSMRC
jgi:hypothetical protein